MEIIEAILQIKFLQIIKTYHNFFINQPLFFILWSLSISVKEK